MWPPFVSAAVVGDSHSVQNLVDKRQSEGGDAFRSDCGSTNSDDAVIVAETLPGPTGTQSILYFK